jgi:hypothetical protein
VLGTGPNSYQLLLKVWLPDPNGSALGLHRLQEVWYDGADGSALSGALIGNDDPLRARVSQTGLVLITDARPELTAGAVFGLVLKMPRVHRRTIWRSGRFTCHEEQGAVGRSRANARAASAVACAGGVRFGRLRPHPARADGEPSGGGSAVEPRHGGGPRRGGRRGVAGVVQ